MIVNVPLPSDVVATADCLLLSRARLVFAGTRATPLRITLSDIQIHSIL